MTEVRTPKKSESIEVRLPYETKRDFLVACKAADRTVSDVVREAIDAYVENGESPRASASAQPDNLVALVPKALRRKRYIVVGAASVLGLAALVALPSAAAPNKAGERAAAFSKLDHNGDGVVSYQEFVAQGREGQGRGAK
ncbi:MAG: EF-hand domain-containing protein [Alphaproteobacteria bacterium]